MGKIKEALNSLKKKNPGKYIKIEDWMVKGYGLQGNELIIYAIIHSFSRNGIDKFKGGSRYFRFWTGKSRPTIFRYIKSLLQKKVIYKTDKYIGPDKARHYCEYWTVLSRMDEKEQEKFIEETSL